jgi:uncharacterized membrane protein
MESRAKALGHAIHPMLIPFPLGLLSTAVVFDLLHLLTDGDGFAVAAFDAIAAGVVGGLIAAPFGWRDWLAIPKGTRARAVGALHGLGNVVVLALFAASWLLRRGEPSYAPGTPEVTLTVAGALLAGVTGWLGGELVERLRVGVDDDAHLDAPSSLRSRSAGH